MALFIDSSEPKEIKDLFAWGVSPASRPIRSSSPRRLPTPTSASAFARSSP